MGNDGHGAAVPLAVVDVVVGVLLLSMNNSFRVRDGIVGDADGETIFATRNGVSRRGVTEEGGGMLLLDGLRFVASDVKAVGTDSTVRRDDVGEDRIRLPRLFVVVVVTFLVLMLMRVLLLLRKRRGVAVLSNDRCSNSTRSLVAVDGAVFATLASWSSMASRNSTGLGSSRISNDDHLRRLVGGPLERAVALGGRVGVAVGVHELRGNGVGGLNGGRDVLRSRRDLAAANVLIVIGGRVVGTVDGGDC